MKLPDLKLNYRGDALILTMFIMAGMLIVAMSGSYVMLLGIKAAGVQSQSTKAYYAAEAGAEKLLYRFRRSRNLNYGIGHPLLVLSGTLNSGASYKVYYDSSSVTPLIFNSIGDFKNSKRSVQIRIGN